MRTILLACNPYILSRLEWAQARAAVRSRWHYIRFRNWCLNILLPMQLSPPSNIRALLPWWESSEARCCKNGTCWCAWYHQHILRFRFCDSMLGIAFEPRQPDYESIWINSYRYGIGDTSGCAPSNSEPANRFFSEEGPYWDVPFWCCIRFGINGLLSGNLPVCSGLRDIDAGISERLPLDHLLLTWNWNSNGTGVGREFEHQRTCFEAMC